MKSYLEEGACSTGPRQIYEENFLSFVRKYFPDPADGNNEVPFIVRSKIHHTFDVCRIGEYIMENDPQWKERTQEERFAGYCACLAHDLSRFPQYKEYRTLQDDRSFDHGERSCEILEKGEYIFPSLSPEWLGKVCRAVRVHNKKEICGSYPEEEIFLARLVRDADKLSILKVVTEYFSCPVKGAEEDVTLHVPDLPSCTEKVLDMALAGKGVSYQDIRCVNDFKIIVFQWPFDLNFASSARYALQEDLFGRLAVFLPEHEKIPLLVKKTMTFLQNLAEGKKE